MAVYLLHFDHPFGHAKHYLGYAEDDRIDARIEHHRNGTGGNLCAHAVKAGCKLLLVRVWPGATRDDERRLKSHSSTRNCPLCTDKPRGPAWLLKKLGVTDGGLASIFRAGTLDQDHPTTSEEEPLDV